MRYSSLNVLQDNLAFLTLIRIRNKLPDVQVHTEVPLPQDAHLPKAHQRQVFHTKVRGVTQRGKAHLFQTFY